MHLRIIIQGVGLLCMAFSLTLLAPILVSLFYQDGEIWHLAISFVAIFVSGGALRLVSMGPQSKLRRRDGFLVVALFWILLSLLGLFPFLFGLHMPFIDSLFESVSGLTTTGATVISGLDQMPRSILLYRQELQWFGGMGLIVLAVAVMPMLGIGGMSIYRAEAPGPMKEEKLTPRLAHSARILWALYVGMTLVCALAFWAAGMSLFDAIAHSLATVSTGGFSTHDASLGYFHSAPVEMIAALFMLLGGINFSIHYFVWHRRNPRYYWKDVEVRTFLTFTLSIILIVTLTLYQQGRGGLATTFRESLFEVISVLTSTGFGVSDFSTWPLFLPVLLIMISFVGGCGGSTAGGMKVMRVLALTKLGYREIIRLLHPQGLFPTRIGGQPLQENTSQAIWGFFSLYLLTFVVLMLIMMAAGLDQVSAFSAIATCMNNLGPGLGAVAQTFSSLNSVEKLTSVAAMLLGRLEIFTFLVLLQPAFWRE